MPSATLSIYSISLPDSLPILLPAYRARSPRFAAGVDRILGHARKCLDLRCREDHRSLRVRMDSWVVERRNRGGVGAQQPKRDRKRTRMNSSHVQISYAVFCLI